jgi:hypothetical protein
MRELNRTISDIVFASRPQRVFLRRVPKSIVALFPAAFPPCFVTL